MILVTEAYSASNLGDLELVRRSVAHARSRRSHPSEKIVVLASDPSSFAGRLGQDIPVCERMFPRLRYLNAGPIRRALMAAWWIARASAVLLVCVPGPRFGRALVRTGLFGGVMARYARARIVVPCGGGYLGDQYVKESVSVALSWRIALRLGCVVETMPMSAEFEQNHLGRCWAKMVGPIVVTARDQESQGRLMQLGVNTRYIPDLAFLNAKSDTSIRPTSREWAVSLVGSDYLTTQELSILCNRLVVAMRPLELSRVLLVSMHTSMAGTQVGGDVQASRVFIDVTANESFDIEEVSFANYSDLVDRLANVDAVISARMHAGIAGICAGVPVGLLAYERKHFALMNDLNMPDMVCEVRSSAGDLVDLVGRLLEGRSTAPVAIARAATVRDSLQLLAERGRQADSGSN